MPDAMRLTEAESLNVPLYNLGRVCEDCVEAQLWQKHPTGAIVLRPKGLGSRGRQRGLASPIRKTGAGVVVEDQA